jgi:TatD DNase family protein
MKLVDSHCHLNYDYAPKSTADLIQEAMQDGISHFVTIGVEIDKTGELEKISSQFDNVFHTVGMHPHEAVTWKEEMSDLVRGFAKNPKCRAIGEIGLDYHYTHSDPESQKRVLKIQLDLALELGLPIVIHSRDAEADLLPELERYAKKVPAGKPVGVIHCFTGTQAFGRACIDLGFYISFSGILTFKSATDLQECAKVFPLNKMMVETDAPYLAPIPFRGKKCEPKMIVQTAQKIASIQGVSFEEVARVTSENSKRLFSI